MAPPLRPKGMSDADYHRMLASMSYPEGTRHRLLALDGRVWADVHLPRLAVYFPDPEGSKPLAWLHARAQRRKVQIDLRLRDGRSWQLTLPGGAPARAELPFASFELASGSFTLRDVEGQVRIVLAPEKLAEPGTRLDARVEEGLFLGLSDGRAASGGEERYLTP